MTENATAERLAALIDSDHDRIVRLWAKRLRAECHELEMTGRELRGPLSEQVSELGRLLHDRAEEALRLWPESVRAHGADRYEQHFEADDLAREFRVLHQVVLHVYARRHGAVEPEMAIFLAELFGEAVASVEACYARVLRTEEVRFREAALMESILHHVDVGILLVENDGRISYATPAVARLMGVPLRALMGGRDARAVDGLLAHLKARYANGTPFRMQDMPYARVLRDKVPATGVMHLDRESDGQEASLELRATPVWDEHEPGRLWGVLQTMTDRSEAERKGRELGSAHEELRRLQGRLLQRTREQVLGQLASGAAHALNNFLNVIRLRTTLLRREYRPDHLDALDRTVHNIGELVGRLQEFAIERAEETPQNVELRILVEEALELARPELERDESRVHLDVDLSSRASVHVDPGLLRELLVNLFLASRDRMPEGGRLHIDTQVNGDKVALRIADSGRSYSEEELQRLFDPFKFTSRTPHFSLLLAVARNQARKWNGDLHCENVADGAMVSLELPLAQDVSLQTPAASAAPARRRRPQNARDRILVVDDDPENARMLAEVLGDEGYDVTVAHSGEAALRLWDERAFDAALLDALMPDMSGWQLARELRGRCPEVLLAMVTGTDVRGQNRANLALVDAVFRKPIDLGALDEFLDVSTANAP